MWNNITTLAVEAIEIDNDGVDNEERETREEVEAEENDVGSGWGTEQEGEGIHPGSEGRPVGDEE